MASSSTAVEATPPWQELPREITASILQKLGAIEILLTAQNVCTTWRSVCKDPSMWRCIDLREPRDVPYEMWDGNDPEKVYRRAVDLSRGQLIDIYIEGSSIEFLLYVSQRSSQLRCLRLANCYNIWEGLTEAIKNLPLLEEMYLHYTSLSVEAIKSIGSSCPLLKSLTLKTHWYSYPDQFGVCDLDALAIAETMPGLRHLQLLGNRMTNKGLLAILEGCPHLQSLDLRRCFNIQFGGEIGKLCSQRIEDLRLPHDPIPLDDRNSDVSATEDLDYPSDFSDMDMVSDYDDDYLEPSDGSVSSYEY